MIPRTPDNALKWIEDHANDFEYYGWDFSWIPAAVKDSVELDDVVIALANADISPFNKYQAGMYLQVQNMYKCYKLKSDQVNKVITFSSVFDSNPTIWESAAEVAEALGLEIYKYIGSMSNKGKYKCPYVAVAESSDLTTENLIYHKKYVCSTTPSRYKKYSFMS